MNPNYPDEDEALSEALDEIELLKSGIDAWRLRAQKAEQDAARYRWLVNCNDSGVWTFLSGMDDDQIDEAIDRWITDDAAVVTSKSKD